MKEKKEKITKRLTIGTVTLKANSVAPTSLKYTGHHVHVKHGKVVPKNKIIMFHSYFRTF